MIIKKLIYVLFLLILCVFIVSCEDFVEVETPDYKLDSQTVFNNEASAQSVLNGIYNQLFNTSFAAGGAQSVTYLAGLSSDNFQLTTSGQELIEFNTNQITTTNSYNLSLWSGAYNIIYQCNALLNNTVGNEALSQVTQDRIEGSGKFIRAFTYFYLVNVYGDVPLLLDTDYNSNALASRSSSTIVYDQIIQDLQRASQLLDNPYPDDDRSRLNRFAAMAMLARVHLYLGNWTEAQQYSSQVIEDSRYQLLNDLDNVFLANSREAIWQISPIGWGNSLTHTREGNLFIKTPTASTPIELSEDFLNTFDNRLDKRYEDWIGLFVDGNDSLYYPHKYKIQYDASGGEIVEYSMVLRLAEQYLIRAEANARVDNLAEAIKDLNVIRSRASLPLAADSSLRKEEVLALILEERRKELFAEWGHRWFDLRRFEQSEQLSEKENSNWKPSSNLFPIPSSERMSNPNLAQNPGY